jgi:S-adenosyl methyltransferase
VVYVDNDPVVLAHARALLTDGPEGATGYLDADIRDVGKILAESGKLLDFSQPIGVMLVAILQFVEDKDDPYRLAAQLIEAVPPSSFVVISHPPNDMQRLAPGLAEALAKLSQAMVQRVTPRSREQVRRFFDGVDLIEPGVVPIQQWRPDSDAEAAARAGMWGGVGRKP